MNVNNLNQRNKQNAEGNYGSQWFWKLWNESWFVCIWIQLFEYNLSITNCMKTSLIRSAALRTYFFQNTNVVMKWKTRQFSIVNILLITRLRFKVLVIIFNIPFYKHFLTSEWNSIKPFLSFSNWSILQVLLISGEIIF